MNSRARRTTVLLLVALSVLVVAGLVALRDLRTPGSLGGTPLPAEDQAVFGGLVSGQQRLELSTLGAPVIRSHAAALELTGDGTRPSGLFFVLQALDPQLVYTVTVQGHVIEGAASLRSRGGDEGMAWRPAPTAGSVQFHVAKARHIELLLYGDTPFTYRAERVAVDVCERCTEQAARARFLRRQYVLRFLAVSFAAGIGCAFLPQMSDRSRPRRFIVGFSMAAVVIALWTTGQGGIHGGLQYWYLIVLPGAASVVLLAALSRWVIKLLVPGALLLGCAVIAMMWVRSAPVILGGASIADDQRVALASVATSGVLPHFTVIGTPDIRPVDGDIEVSGDGASPAGMFLVFDHLDPTATYRVAVSGTSLVGNASLRVRPGSGQRVYVRPPVI